MHFFSRFSSRSQLRSLVSLGLGGLSLLVLLVAFQLNFRHQQLFTQVLVTDESGSEEMMIFRDYRDEQASNVEKMLSDCLLRNELFGDGTGDICEIHRQQLDCVESSMSKDALLECYR